jgi:hypothetical protein
MVDAKEKKWKEECKCNVLTCATLNSMSINPSAFLVPENIRT